MRSHYLRMVSNTHHQLQSRRALSRGFGLVELMVSISIMVLVTGVIMARHDSFNSAALLRNQAYEIALSIREIQLLAVSATRDVESGEFRNIYGLRFEAENNQFVIFRDDGDYTYDEGDTAVGPIGVIDPRFEIVAITDSAGTDVGGLQILFERPNFDAMLFDATSSIAEPVNMVVGLRGNPAGGRTYTIEITPAGQISVDLSI